MLRWLTVGLINMMMNLVRLIGRLEVFVLDFGLKVVKAV